MLSMGLGRSGNTAQAFSFLVTATFIPVTLIIIGIVCTKFCLKTREQMQQSIESICTLSVHSLLSGSKSNKIETLLTPYFLHYSSPKEKEGEGRLKGKIVLCLILQISWSFLQPSSHNSSCQVSLLFFFQKYPIKNISEETCYSLALFQDLLVKIYCKKIKYCWYTFACLKLCNKDDKNP